MVAKKEKAPPKQLFVVSQDREEYEWSETGQWEDRIVTHHNFGFLHPHEPQTRPDVNRKRTQMQWAYGYKEVYQKEDGVWWWKGDTGKWIQHKDIDPRTGKPRYEYIPKHFDEPIPLDYAPKIWDNVPLSGFRIISPVNRNRGNKLLKVLDPRGIEFEITVNSAFNLLDTGTISKGEIKGKCVWKMNKELVFA